MSQARASAPIGATLPLASRRNPRFSPARARLPSAALRGAASRQSEMSNRSTRNIASASAPYGITRSMNGLCSSSGIAAGRVIHVTCAEGWIVRRAGRMQVVRSTSPSASSLMTRIRFPTGS